MANIVMNVQGMPVLPAEKPAMVRVPKWIELGQKAFWHARRIKDAEIKCLSGLIWITEEGNLNDNFLRPGETARVSGKGLVVIEALADAQVILS